MLHLIVYLSDRLRLEGGFEGHRDVVEESVEAGMLPPDAADTLAVLRKHGFQVKPAETELGYSHKSKTLSNHLRGMCLEAASRHSWDAQGAAASLAEGCPPAVVAKLKRKIERYTRNVGDNIAQHTEDRLYRNLPVAYHGALKKMIEHLRRSRVA